MQYVIDIVSVANYLENFACGSFAQIASLKSSCIQIAICDEARNDLNIYFQREIKIPPDFSFIVCLNLLHSLVKV